MATRRSALGRGLGALIPEPREAPRPRPTETPEPASPAAEAARAGSGLQEIPVDRIVPNPQQPRRVFDEADLRSLADSLSHHGVLQPVVVREAGDGRYELVVGERRWRAARLAGLAAVPAAVKDVASPELLELALVENVQRRDLNPIELAQAFRAMADGGATQEQIGERVGLDRSTVANLLRLLELPTELQEDVEAGRLSAGHAKALLQVPQRERRHRLRERVLAEDLSVRATEDLARAFAEQAGRPSRRRSRKPEIVDPNLSQLVDALQDRLKTRVRISGTASRGKLEIEFYGPEDLHRVTSAILDGV